MINGHYYASREPARILKDGRVIMDQIGTQLASCPRSVVIMDVSALNLPRRRACNQPALGLTIFGLVRASRTYSTWMPGCCRCVCCASVSEPQQRRDPGPCCAVDSLWPPCLMTPSHMYTWLARIVTTSQPPLKRADQLKSPRQRQYSSWCDTEASRIRTPPFRSGVNTSDTRVIDQLLCAWQVSDLGEAALDPAMTRSQATEAVRNATRNHWPGAKLPKFVSDVVPFQPLSLAEMAMVAQLELEKYRDGAVASREDTPLVPCNLVQPTLATDQCWWCVSVFPAERRDHLS